jgi:hypothetical protein
MTLFSIGLWVSNILQGHEQWQSASETHQKISPHPYLSNLALLQSEISWGLEDMGLSSQCGTWRIDIICKVVTHSVLVAIDNIDSRRSIFGNKPCE